MSEGSKPKPAQHLLGGLHVAILVNDGFEQVEMTEPRAALHEAGVITRIVSVHKGQVRGYHHDAPADSFDVDLTLEQARADDFDAVLLPGGERNAASIRGDARAQAFVRQIDKEGKPLAVICHAPWLLVSAAMVEGRTLTSFPSLEQDIRQAGGHWVDEPVQIDRNWISSRKPGDIPAFNAAFKEVLARRTKGSVKGTADDLPSAAAMGG